MDIILSLKLFFDEVKEMREAQKEYFKTRSSDVLRKAKELERKVDKFIETFDNPDEQKKMSF